MKLISITLLFLFALSACKKKQPEMGVGQNACDCIEATSADFTIEEVYAYGYPWEKRTETDTIFNEKNVVFTAKEKSAEYKWYIGIETIDSKEFGRYFDGTLAGQNITVTLVVKKSPNLKCFPLDDGYDSISKVFNVSMKANDLDSFFEDPNPQFEGVYRMKEKNGLDSIELTVELYSDPISGETIRIYNYDGQGANSPMNYYGGYEGHNYRQVWYHYNNRTISLHRKINGEVELDMINSSILEPVQSYYLKGRKL